MPVTAFFTPFRPRRSCAPAPHAPRPAAGLAVLLCAALALLGALAGPLARPAAAQGSASAAERGTWVQVEAMQTLGEARNRAQIYAEDGARDRLLGQHRAVYEAIMARDADAARAAAQAHMAHVRLVLQSFQEDQARAEIARLRLGRYEAGRREAASANGD